MKSRYDVIIAGGGPVGLFLACELALARCSVLVLERAEDPSSPLKKLPFGLRGLSAPSIEALDRRGLLAELEIHKRIKNPHAITGPRQVGHFAGIPFFESLVEPEKFAYRLPTSTAPTLISEIFELETVFARRALALGVEIRRGLGVTDLNQNADGVVVQAGGQQFSSAYLVGCDGSRSVVRKSGGFEFAGTEPEFTGYTMSVELVESDLLKPGRNLTERGMYMQSQPGYLMMQDFDGGAFHASGAPLTLEHLQKTLRRISATEVTLAKLHVATTWTDRARQATTYRKGRVLLAGDAAHIHSPLGGQGLNLGLGDAMNLGWKLAATIRGQADETLLDTYFGERHPVGAQVLDWSRAQVSVMKPDPASRAMNAVLRELMATSDAATYFAGRVWGLATRYALGDAHPLVGRSVPNFSFADGSTTQELMRDGRGLVIEFNEESRLQNLAEKIGASHVGLAAAETLGLRALVVRPDGIVVYAGTEDVSQAELAHYLCV